MKTDHGSPQVNTSRVPRLLKTISIILIGLSVGACPGPDRQTPQQVVAQLVQEGYLKASNSGVNDRFGVVLAIDGDTLVVGAPFESSASIGVNGNQTDNSASASGAVYVFARVNGNWMQQAYLKASNSNSGDLFGGAVALSGDTLVVGAVSEASSATGVNGNQSDNTAPHSGAVYVFVRVSGVWSQEAYIKASNTNSGDEFGVAVSISGDTLVVGSWLEDSNAVGVNGVEGDNSTLESGATYVFTRSGSSWSQQAYIKASNTGSGDRFGKSIAIDEDTLVVGAPTESSSATGINGNQLDDSLSQAGAVYVFKRTGGIWAQEAYVKASNTSVNDQFGQSVALSSDTFAVGAWYENSAATGINGSQLANSTVFSGAAYVFVKSGGSWTQQAYIKASNAEHDDQFGVAIALSGDDLVIGAWAEDGSSAGINGNDHDNLKLESGAAYVFRRTAGVWSQDFYVKASNTGAGDQLGWGVGISGGLLAVGAPFEASAAFGINGNQADNSAPQSGAAYVFQRR